jgi:hypothetical protein
MFSCFAVLTLTNFLNLLMDFCAMLFLSIELFNLGVNLVYLFRELFDLKL